MTKAKKKPAKKKAAKKRKLPPKQTTLPGTSTRSKKIPSISKAAEKHDELKRARMDFGERELKARTLLEGLMQKHKLTEYHDPDLQLKVTMEGNVKAKTTRTKDE